MTLTLEEKETIILYNEAEKTASVYTCSPSLQRKLDKLSATSKEFSLCVEDKHSKTYIFPKKLISIRKPYKITAERRAELSQIASEKLVKA